MNEQYTHQYLELIEDVAEDGELTYQEIYRLAKWLNENPHGRETWPANQFLPLLKSIFADGKIETSEAHAVAKMVQRVRREWARANLGQATAVEDVEIAIRDFDDSQPLLPLIPNIVQVTSFSEPGIVYNVDLSGPNCDCADFKSHRANLPVGHISRCCKHIMQSYSEIRPSTGWPSWLESLLEAGFKPYPAQAWQVYKSPSGIHLICSAHPTWGNVYSRIGDKPERYGYSIDEDRWSYGKEPIDAGPLARIVCSLSN